MWFSVLKTSPPIPLSPAFGGIFNLNKEKGNKRGRGRKELKTGG
jgi:hypothetical protein